MSRLLLLFAALAAAAGVARANGRFPASTGVVFHPGDTDTMLVPATFGLLITRDGGDSFHYVCEAAIGYDGVFDPDYAVSPEGTLFATTFDGLRVSRDGGCTWRAASDPPGALFPAAVAVAADGDVWTAASVPADNELYRSADDGVSFVATGASRPGAVWVSLVTAPGAADRVYASAFHVTSGEDPDAGDPVALVRSDDDGATWLDLPVADFALGAEPRLYVEAVSPADADVVFARVRRATPPNGDALYRSDDAGATWTRVLEVSDEILAVVVRADGQTVLAGTLFDGVHVSNDGGQSFAEAADAPQMACAGERGDGVLFSCGANWEPDRFALGRSDEPTGWTPFLVFDDLSGPLACDPDTVQFEQCALVEWPVLVEQLGIGDPPDAGPGAPDAGPLDAAPGASGGGGGGGGCGCTLAFASALVLIPGRRRRGY